MGSIKAGIKSVKQIFEEEREHLHIPPYQRPYRWKSKNVKQLLEDIAANKNAGKQKYRIGSVILYENQKNGGCEIVDGQQRITTLLLLARACGIENDLLGKLEYKHSDSKKNIIDNYKYVTEWINEYYPNRKEECWRYVEESCEFVVIVVDDLSEAFQMFDSQNGRGKELEAYNLLKAYHIRAMEQDSREEKVACDKRWEAATMYDATPTVDGDPNVDVLRQIFNEQLFRGRVWSKGKLAHVLKKSDIDEFKGFTIDKNHNIDFPFQNPYLLQYQTAKFYNTILSGTVTMQSRFACGDNDKIDPFVSITQQIVNGKAFFDYVETYVEIYKQLFILLKSSQLREFKSFFYKYCLNYGGELSQCDSPKCFYTLGVANRSGDTYLREAYKTVVMLLFDKFGEKGLNKYYKVLYKLIYCERLSSQVRRDTVAKLPIGCISVINHANNMADLVELEEMWIDKKRKIDESRSNAAHSDVLGIKSIVDLLFENH